MKLSVAVVDAEERGVGVADSVVMGEVCSSLDLGTGRSQGIDEVKSGVGGGCEVQSGVGGGTGDMAAEGVAVEGTESQHAQ